MAKQLSKDRAIDIDQTPQIISEIRRRKRYSSRSATAWRSTIACQLNFIDHEKVRQVLIYNIWRIMYTIAKSISFWNAYLDFFRVGCRSVWFGSLIWRAWALQFNRSLGTHCRSKYLNEIAHEEICALLLPSMWQNVTGARDPAKRTAFWALPAFVLGITRLVLHPYLFQYSCKR